MLGNLFSTALRAAVLPKPVKLGILFTILVILTLKSLFFIKSTGIRCFLVSAINFIFETSLLTAFFAYFLSILSASAFRWVAKLDVLTPLAPFKSASDTE